MNNNLLIPYEYIKSVNETNRLSENLLQKPNKTRISRYETSDVTKCGNQDPNDEVLRSTTMECLDLFEGMDEIESKETLKYKRNKSCYCYFILWLGLVLNLAWLVYGAFAICNYVDYKRHTTKGWVRLLAFWIIIPMAAFIGLLVGLIKSCKFKKQ